MNAESAQPDIGMGRTTALCRKLFVNGKPMGKSCWTVVRDRYA